SSARFSAQWDQSTSIALTSASNSLGPCTGDGVNRSRSVPRGTVGKLMGCT
ncbi:unnamed protein product, partial [Ectocarpus sp. 12 AP-2014]